MVTATPTQTVTITRSINSTPEEVYRALTTVTGLQGWLCDNAHLRLEVGGHLHFAWNTPQFHASGEFTEIEENTRLGFTWLGANEDDKTHVTIDIAQDGETVDLTLTHSDVSSGEAAQGYKHEWERTLNNLVSMLETGADHRITKRVIMGILPTGVSDKEREKYGLEEGEGTKINSVLDGYSAQKAGLQADDIVVEVEGQKIDANFNIFRAITAAGKEAGDSVKIVYLRDGERETVDLELLSYPVPDVPDTFDALADRTKATYDEQIATIRNLYAGKSDEVTATPPAENEWSADEVVAHLILNERWMQAWLGSFMQGPRPNGYSCNTYSRIRPLTAAYNNGSALVDELERSFNETVAIMRNVDEDAAKRPATKWWMSFQLSQFKWHTDNHTRQIEEALVAVQQ